MTNQNGGGGSASRTGSVMGLRGRPVDVLRGPFDPGGQPRLESPHELWLGLFAWNVGGGCTASRAILRDPERYQHIWRWETAQRLVRMADRMGLEFQLSAARWLGHGGETRFHEDVLESLVATPATAPITERVLLLSTAHVTYGYHPLHFAKMGATIDQISGGRWGLNIVTGWVADEQALFGREFPDHEARYEMADEFVTLMKWVWASDEPIDFEGKYYRSYGAYTSPKPARKPRPFLINAGSSPTGIDFAARQCDWLFCLGDVETCRAASDSLQERTGKYGRHAESMTFAWLVIEDSDARAEAVAREVTEQIDERAVDTFLLRGFEGSRSGHATGAAKDSSNERLPGNLRLRETLGERYIGAGIGLGGQHIVGSPDTVAEGLRALHERGGQRGIMLSFFDYLGGMERLERDVLPRLRKMGLR